MEFLLQNLIIKSSFGKGFFYYENTIRLKKINELNKIHKEFFCALAKTTQKKKLTLHQRIIVRQTYACVYVCLYGCGAKVVVPRAGSAEIYYW